MSKMFLGMEWDRNHVFVDGGNDGAFCRSISRKYLLDIHGAAYGGCLVVDRP